LTACADRWPTLLDERRIDALLPWRQVHAPDAADNPVQVETFRGFNILRYHAQYIGVAQNAGAIDLRVGTATVATRLGPARAVIADTLEEIRSRITMLAALQVPAAPTAHGGGPDGPELVESIHDFNIVRVGTTFVGLRHRIGMIEFGQHQQLQDLVDVFRLR
jgi:hypothetical protein